ncbi:adenylate/guanylate cyclase domain-containing protein [uncultured Jatrophihabitans sp.]|uniref:adenylate/guanylate cyclase domain-containing protein n=1 Tax=uncultured Jatrophihabitans sp. TaxID=1610747 RepID=UPI0035C9725B
MSEGPQPAPPSRGEPVDVAKVASNLPFVLRTIAGMVALAVTADLVGVAVVAVAAAVLNAQLTGRQTIDLVVTGVVLAVVSIVVGVVAATAVQRRTLRWLLRGDPPSAEDARRALRMPLDLAVITLVLWSVGGLVVGVVAALLGVRAQVAAGLGSGTVIAGLGAAGVTYLLIARTNRRVALLALAARPPKTTPVFGVRARLQLSWALTTGAPILGVILVLTAPQAREHVVATAIVVAALALAVGGLATALTARSVGVPLRGIVDALRRVEQGDFDVHLDVDDAGEIGLVQNGFNDMVSGLRERERIQDLFGRHVGSAVAAQAIDSGVTLTGESRDVVALFVDITGSTRLTRERAPTEFVAMLNRFFETVVDEVEGANGGLLNKFEGDAALCVFGAPAELADPATAGLRAARAIRDRVAASGELSIGIGVAYGPVIAGQIGAASRLEYTVIGDAVNEAARLTELAKRVDGCVLASAAAVEASVEAEQENWVRTKTVRLRGRESPTRAYRTA